MVCIVHFSKMLPLSLKKFGSSRRSLFTTIRHQQQKKPRANIFDQEIPNQNDTANTQNQPPKFEHNINQGLYVPGKGAMDPRLKDYSGGENKLKPVFGIGIVVGTFALLYYYDQQWKAKLIAEGKMLSDEQKWAMRKQKMAEQKKNIEEYREYMRRVEQGEVNETGTGQIIGKDHVKRPSGKIERIDWCKEEW